MNEKIVECLKNEEVAKEFFAQETVEDAQKFLASKGVEVSAKEIEEIGAAVAAQTEDEGEMDDSQLDKVAGGAYIGMDGKLHTVPGAGKTTTITFGGQTITVSRVGCSRWRM
jgi:hypothetical protein